MPGHAELSIVCTLPPLKAGNPIILLSHVNAPANHRITFATISQHPDFAPAASSAFPPYTYPAGDILVVLQNQFRSINGSGASE